MNVDIEKYKSELTEFITSCRTRLDSVLSALQWTEEDTLKNTSSEQKSNENEKDDKDDPLLPDSFGCLNSVVICEDELKNILDSENVKVPKKFSDIQVNFSREEKLAIYDYAIRNTSKTHEPELKISRHEGGDGNDTSLAEIVAKKKKEEKKQRRKYRTSRPTHTEQVRNLVHLQMQALRTYLRSHTDKHKLNESVTSVKEISRLQWNKIEKDYTRKEDVYHRAKFNTIHGKYNSSTDRWKGHRSYKSESDNRYYDNIYSERRNKDRNVTRDRKRSDNESSSDDGNRRRTGREHRPERRSKVKEREKRRSVDRNSSEPAKKKVDRDKDGLRGFKKRRRSETPNEASNESQDRRERAKKRKKKRSRSVESYNTAKHGTPSKKRKKHKRSSLDKTGREERPVKDKDHSTIGKGKNRIQTSPNSKCSSVDKGGRKSRHSKKRKKVK